MYMYKTNNDYYYISIIRIIGVILAFLTRYAFEITHYI